MKNAKGLNNFFTISITSQSKMAKDKNEVFTMKGKITHWSKAMLRKEILHRMGALDTSCEEYSNDDLLIDYENLTKHNSSSKKELKELLKEAKELNQMSKECRAELKRLFNF